jgi:short-subunit dehydrogenase
MPPRRSIEPGVTEKRIWCTGAGKGLGRSVALTLAARGHHVAISARTRSDLDALVDEAADLPGQMVAFPLDVADESAVFGTLEDIENSLGPLDLVILNAGTHIPVDAASLTVKPFRDLMETNFMGTMHGVAAVLPRFIGRGRGHLAVVASVAGYRGLPTSAAYGASKAALINMCEALKPELDRAGVTISVVNPGFVKTPLTDRNDFPMPFLMEADDAAEQMVRGLESGRFEITFPKRFTWGMKLLRCLPYSLYFAVSRRFLPKS